MEFEEANLLLDPGFLPFESGYRELSAHKMLVAALTRMPGCRAKMVNWWFSWLDGIDQYKLWHPRDHVASAWLNRVDGQYIGASHIVSEYLAGPTGSVHDLQIDFHDPLEIFDAERYRASGSVAVRTHRRATRSDSHRSDVSLRPRHGLWLRNAKSFLAGRVG